MIAIETNGHVSVARWHRLILREPQDAQKIGYYQARIKLVYPQGTNLIPEQFGNLRFLIIFITTYDLRGVFPFISESILYSHTQEATLHYCYRIHRAFSYKHIKSSTLI